MLLQFFGVRTISVPKEDVIKIIRGAIKDRTGATIISNKTVIDLKDAKAKLLLKMYPNEFEKWGQDAVEKKPTVKANNSKSKGHANRDIA